MLNLFPVARRPDAFASSWRSTG